MQEGLHPRAPTQASGFKDLGLLSLSPKEASGARPGEGTPGLKGGSGSGGTLVSPSPASRVSCWKDERGSSLSSFKTLSVTNFSGYFQVSTIPPDLGASLWSLAQGTVGWARAGWP